MEYSQVTCLRGKFSSSLFLKKKMRLSYFTVWQGLKLQVQSDFPSEFGEAPQLCSDISVANGRSHVVVDSVGFCVPENRGFLILVFHTICWPPTGPFSSKFISPVCGKFS